MLRKITKISKFMWKFPKYVVLKNALTLTFLSLAVQLSMLSTTRRLVVILAHTYIRGGGKNINNAAANDTYIKQTIQC